MIHFIILGMSLYLILKGHWICGAIIAMYAVSMFFRHGFLLPGYNV